MIIQGEEFSGEKRSCVIFLIFIFILVKLTILFLSLCLFPFLSKSNEFLLLAKISFTRDEGNQSWGNKSSPSCLWNMVYRRHRQPTTRAGHGRPFCPLQSSNPPTLSRVKRYTIHTPPAKLEGETAPCKSSRLAVLN